MSGVRDARVAYVEDANAASSLFAVKSLESTAAATSLLVGVWSVEGEGEAEADGDGDGADNTESGRP